jgi:hypothetical protein
LIAAADIAAALVAHLGNHGIPRGVSVGVIEVCDVVQVLVRHQPTHQRRLCGAVLLALDAELGLLGARRDQF